MEEQGNPLLGGLMLALFGASGLAWAAIARRRARGEPSLEFESRFSVPWSGLDAVTLAIVMVFCEIAALSIVDSASGDTASGVSPATLLAASAARLAWMALAVGYLVVKCGAYPEDLGWDTSRAGRDARMGGLVFLAAALPVFGVQLFFVYGLDIESRHPLVELAGHEPSAALLVLATVLAVVVAPLFEEFAFRVVLQGWLEAQQVRLRQQRGEFADDRPGWAPIVITSLLFASLHLGHGADPFALFVFSLFLGYAYRQTHRLLPPLVAHAALNAFTMLNLWIMYLGGSSPSPLVP